MGQIVWNLSRRVRAREAGIRHKAAFAYMESLSYQLSAQRITAFDTIYTKRLIDKIHLWFIPTRWRPRDVAERYPVAVIDRPKDHIKYDLNPP